MDNPVWSYIFGPPKEKRSKIALMRELPAFEGLSDWELVMVERNIHQRRFGVGEVIFGEDMPGAGMYIIKSGEVLIQKKTKEGQVLKLATIGERNFFGEMALIDEIPRSASAVAEKETILLAFCKPDLDNVFDRNPRLAAKIVKNISRLICKRLVKANENLEALQGVGSIEGQKECENGE